MSYKSVLQEECPSWLPQKSVFKECLTRMSHERAPSECLKERPIRVSWQECLDKGVQQECHTRVTSEDCPTRASKFERLTRLSHSGDFAEGVLQCPTRESHQVLSIQVHGFYQFPLHQQMGIKSGETSNCGAKTIRCWKAMIWRHSNIPTLGFDWNSKEQKQTKSHCWSSFSLLPNM